MPHSIESIASTRRKTKESVRVESLIPSDLREPAQQLIHLLQDYYTHINETGQASSEINSLVTARDIDVTKTEYLDMLQKEIAAAIPKNTVTNRVNLYKNLSRYYNVRGSQESIELFFKIIFSDDAEVYFPRKYMLVPSDGIWIPDTQVPNYSAAPLIGVIGNGIGATAFATTVNGAIRNAQVTHSGSLYPCPTATIAGNGSNATVAVYVAGGVIRSIAVTNGGSGYTTASVVITGTHTIAATATAEIVNGSIVSINLTNGGSGYPSPTLTITDAPGSGGSGAEALAYCVGGSITHVQMTSFGSGYSVPVFTFAGATGSGAQATGNVVNGAIESITATNFGSGYTAASVLIDGMPSYASSAKIIPNISRDEETYGQILSYTVADCGEGYTIAGIFTGYSYGTYTQRRGFVSDIIKLQDSYFYQKFSYVIRTGNNVDVWADTFNKLVHPAGMIFFGEILLLLQLIDGKSMMPKLQPGYIGAEDLAKLIVSIASTNLNSYIASSYKMSLNIPTGTNTSYQMKYFDSNGMQTYDSMTIAQAETLYPYDDYSIQTVINTSPTWNGTTLGVNFVT